MNGNKTVPLTSSETASLWTAYTNDSMSICVLRQFLNHVQDKEIQSILQQALQLSEVHVKKIINIMTQERFPIPVAFSDHDVDVTAPRLYSDVFYIVYIQQMGAIGVNSYAMALNNAFRGDITQYFNDCLTESKDLYIRVSDTMFSKGIMVRSPYIPMPNESEFVEKQSFFSGFFHERRPLNALEIGNLFFNIQRDVLGIALITGFSQVAHSEKVKGFMMRGADISKKHIDIFGSILREDQLTVPMLSGAIATDSKVAPFSDKLMMFHITALIAISLAQYGAALSTSPRHDLAVNYARLSTNSPNMLKTEQILWWIMDG